MTSSSLLDRRLCFVVGKGGVGKSTVAAALAFAALRRGKRVLLVEMDREDRLRPLLGLPPSPSGTTVEVRPGLFRTNVEGTAALEEYLGMVVPVRRVLGAIFESKVYQYFVAAAPGLKELMAVGKIFYEVEQSRWDLVVVDCPATGHALQLLRMPKTASETFPSGLVHREAERVWRLLRDERSTAVSVVTTPEEMPVNETIDLCRQLRDDLGLPEGVLFLNRYHSPPLPREDLDRAARKARGWSPLVDAVLAAAGDELTTSEANARHRARLERALDWPVVRLPFLFREEFGLPDVERFAAEIDAALSRRPRRRAERRG